MADLIGYAVDGTVGVQLVSTTDVNICSPNLIYGVLSYPTLVTANFL